MASNESMAILQSSSMQDSECDFDDDGEYDYRPGHPHNLSRVGTNNSAVYGHDDEGDSVGGNYFHIDDGCCDTISTHMSQLSMESFPYGDADEHEEFSEDERESKEISSQDVSSNSDQESFGDCYLLPATPPRPRPRWRNHSVGLDQVLQLQPENHKEYYTSENKAKLTMNTMRRDRCRLERTSFGAHDKKVVAAEDEAMIDSSGEEGSGDLLGSSVVIRTRPRGGRRSLCMDLEEVKACRDLGFDLEHDHCTTLHSSSSVAVMPTTTTTSLSISENSNLDTSSGTNCPITKWRISSPGDDPREVKARLRVWAQAVALASTSSNCC